MPAIRIYEAALCCVTGVCGADIARNNLASEPTAFAEDETGRGFMHLVGSKGLPLTIVDGVTVAAGTSPSRKQLLAFAGLGESAEEQHSRPGLGLTEKKSGGCGCGGSASRG